MIAYVLSVKRGELDRALTFVERSFTLAKQLDNNLRIAFSLYYMALIYSLKGELEDGIKLYEQALQIFKKFNNKFAMANVFNDLAGNFMIKGDLDQALEYIESSIKINNEFGYLHAVANNYDYLIQILIKRGELERAQQRLEEFEKLTNQLKDKSYKLVYLFQKALILKTSARSRDKVKTEDILKHILEDKAISFETAINTLLNLCELLLIELQITNDLSVLEEINSYTAQLLEIAEKSRSYILFAETYFLKGKLALLTLDVKNSRRFLTQAQKIAEKFGLNQLAAKITYEHNNLLEQLSMWENLKETDIDLIERIKLAGLDKQMKNLLQKSAIITAYISQ